MSGTADIYEQEERSLLNIFPVVGSLGTQRLHFRSIPAVPAKFEVRTASCPAAVLVTGIPGKGRGYVCDVITVHQPVTVLRSRHPLAENTPVRSVSASGRNIYICGGDTGRSHGPLFYLKRDSKSVGSEL